MKRVFKILITILGIIIVILIAGYFAITPFLNSAYLKNLVSRIASESLKHPVEIGNVSLKLGFKIGIAVDEINIPNLPGFTPEPMVQVKKTSFNLKLFPLFRRQIVIGSIDFNNLNLNIERNKDNQINFVALIPKESKGTNWQMSLEGVNISKANINYRDAITDIKLQIREMNQKIVFENSKIKISGNETLYLLKGKILPEAVIEVRNNLVYDTLNKSIEFQKVSLNYQPLTLNITGSLEKLEIMNLNLDLKIDDLSKLSPLIPLNSRPQKLKGSLSTNVSIMGSVKEPKLNGKCELKDVSIRPKGMNRDMEKIDGGFTFDQNSIRNIIIMGMCGTTKFDVTGSVNNLKNPLIDLNLKIKGNLNDFESITEELKDTKLSGELNVNVTAKGSVGKPSYFGEYSITNGNIEVIGLKKPITNFQIRGTIQNDAAKVSNCSGHIGRSDFSFSGYITNFKNPIIQLDNTSNLIDLDELLPKEKKEAKKPSRGIPITIQGSVKINRLIGMEMEFKNINTNFTYKDGVVDLKNCSAEAFDGSVQFDFYYDSKSPEPYRINTRMNNISAQGILKRFLKLENLEARLSGLGNFWGKGLDQAQVVKNLSASGNLQLTNGAFKNFPFLIQLFDYLGLKDYRTISFNDLVCVFKIENGKTKIEDWTISSNVGDFLTNGTLGLDGRINLDITLMLKKRESDLLKKYHGDWVLYYDKNGCATVDITATGKILSPQFKLASAKIKERLKGKIKDEFDKKKKELKKRLKDLLKK